MTLTSHVNHTVRELLPELVTQLVNLLVSEESVESQEVGFSFLLGCPAKLYNACLDCIQDDRRGM